MICTKCNQKLMERYNGQLFCEKCGTGKHGEELTVTADSERAAVLSELYFLRHIAPVSGALATKRSLLDDAISFCKVAASAGHPKAIFRMGYYYEFFYKDKYSETERAQRAFQYYWRLCGPSAKLSLNQILRPNVVCTTLPTENDWLMLQKQAAEHIFDLFSLVPWAFSGGANNRYQRAKRHLIAIYKSAKSEQISEDRTGSGVDEVQRIISSCYSKERPPLLGLFHMRSAALRELLSLRASSAEGRKHNMNKMCEDLLFHYLPCNRDGSLGRQTDFVRIRDAVYPDELGEDDYLYFLFLNKGGKHLHLNGSKLRHFEAEVIDDQSELLDFISGSARKQLLLFEEDIIFMRRVLKGNFSDLIADICDEGV